MYFTCVKLHKKTTGSALIFLQPSYFVVRSFLDAIFHFLLFINADLQKC